MCAIYKNNNTNYKVIYCDLEKIVTSMNSNVSKMGNNYPQYYRVDTKSIEARLI